MEILLIRYYIRNERSDGGGTIESGHYVNVMWDDVLLSFSVYEFDSSSDTIGDLMTSGPDLGFVSTRGRTRPPADTDVISPVGAIIPYSYCNGPTLESFKWKGQFPYAEKVSSPNSFQCISTVCDITFINYSTENATDITAQDGIINVEATSSNGVIKYSLDPSFNYVTDGQTSGDFIGVYPGTYTVTAKDEIGCFVSVNVVVGVPDFYNVKYRLDYDDAKGKLSRVDILERGYDGEPILVTGSGDPVIIVANDQDSSKFGIIPSSIVVSLISMENFYFKDLFTQDDRKYQVKHYKDFDDGLELNWIGFVIPQNYKEAYLAPPYQIDITATDGIEDLKTFDLIDNFGNKFKNDLLALDAIAQILQKTDLKIEIQSGLNKYEQNMNDGLEDDPLNQFLFDPVSFYDTKFDCLYVLSELLKPFGAKLRQRRGKWFIYLTEEIVHGIAYREFNYRGEYIGNGTIEDIHQIKISSLSDRLSFRDGIQNLEVLPAYGKFYLEHSLQKNASLVKSYSFESDDLYIDPNGIVLLKNWNVNIQNEPGGTYGIKETKAFEGTYNFYAKAGTISYPNLTGKVILTSIVGLIEFESVDAFEFGFSYSVVTKGIDASQNPGFIRIKWKLQIGDFFYNEASGSWVDNENFKYNDLYVDTFNEPLNFKIVDLLPDVDELTLNSFNVEFILYRENAVEFITTSSDISVINDELKSIPTINLPIGYRLKGQSNGSLFSGRYRYYKLTDDIDAAGAIEPDDFDSEKPKLWIFEDSIGVRSERSVSFIYLDNVILKHFPNGIEPPNSITVVRTSNPLLKINLVEEFVFNDIDIDNINNSERTYRNYFKLLDGTPTQVWTRTYRSGQGKLLDLLSDEYRSQYKRGSYKLTGSFTIDIDVSANSLIIDNFDNGRGYMFLGYTLHDKHCKLDFDLCEIVDTITDDTSPEIDAGFTSGFSLGFRA